MTGKWDKEIKELFHQGFGAREIAKELGVKHHATVSKRLIKLNLQRPIGSNQSEVDGSKLAIRFNPDKTRLHRAAQDYLKFICRISGYGFLIPDEEEPFDLMVDFGNGYKKVQVKSSYCKTSSCSYKFKIIRTRNNSTSTKKISYTKEEVDYFFLMDMEYNCWLIPFEKLNPQRTVIPNKRFPGYKI